MRFLVDAQLPPSLAEALRTTGNDAFHVGDFDLLAAADQRVWQEAVTRSAVLVTKDRDFSLIRAARGQGPCVLWIRTGNCDNRLRNCFTPCQQSSKRSIAANPLSNSWRVEFYVAVFA
ncbi:MAG TPA: DUF5615 family PIN-like protein [Tardiphaga sp.]